MLPRCARVFFHVTTFGSTQSAIGILSDETLICDVFAWAHLFCYSMLIHRVPAIDMRLCVEWVCSRRRFFFFGREGVKRGFCCVLTLQLLRRRRMLIFHVLPHKEMNLKLCGLHLSSVFDVRLLALRGRIFVFFHECFLGVVSFLDFS